MTALMLQMMKQMREQQRVTQDMMQEQQRVANERQRHFMAAILERRADQTPTATRSTIEKSPLIIIYLNEFSGEPEDWTTWSKVHRAQLSALGCAGRLLRFLQIPDSNFLVLSLHILVPHSSCVYVHNLQKIHY